MKHFLLACLYLIISTISVAQKIQTTIQRGHHAPISTVSFSPDGKFALTGSKDKLIKLWDVAKGREIRTFTGHNGPVYVIKFDPSGEFFYSAGSDGKIWKWGMETGQLISSFQISDRPVTDLLIDKENNAIIVGGLGPYLKVYSFDSVKVIDSIKVNPYQEGIDLEWVVPTKSFVVAQDNGEARLHAYPSLDTIFTLRNINYGNCSGCYTKVAKNKKGSLLLTASNNGPFLLWGAKKGEGQTTFLSKKDNYVGLGFCDNEGKVAVANSDSIWVFYANTGRLAYAIKPHDKEVRAFSISGDGEYLLTGSNDNTARLFNARTGKLERVLKGYLNENIDNGLDYDPDSYWYSFQHKVLSKKNQVLISPNGRYAVRDGVGKHATMWDLYTGKPYRKFVGHSKLVSCFEFDREGKKLITGSADQKVIIWDIQTAKPIQIFDKHYSMISDVALSNNQKELAVACYDGTVSVWDIETGTLHKKIHLSAPNEKREIPFFVRFSPNDLYILTGSLSKKLQMWEVDSGTGFREFAGPTDVPSDLIFVQGGQKMLSSSWDHSIRVWDIVSGYQYAKLTGHQDEVNCLDISADGKLMVSGSADRTVKIWDIGALKEVVSMQGHQSEVVSVQFFDNGTKLLSSSIDGETKIWDVGTGQELFTQFFIGDNDYMAINPSGYFYASEGARKHVFFVDGLNSYRLDQFFNTYYNPKIIEESLSAHFNQNNNLWEELQANPPPKVQIVSPKGHVETEDANFTLMLKLENTGAGVSEVKVLHNGKRLPINVTGLDKLNDGKKGLYQEYPLSLMSGINILEISAINQKGIESEALRAYITYKGEIERPDCYVLAVGINKYANEKLDLKYAQNDAQSFLKTIKKSEGSLFKQVKVMGLYNEKATKEQILSYLKALSKLVKPSDVFMFYYAGHGSMPSKEFYFVPSNNTSLYNENALAQDAISTSGLQKYFQNIPALKQAVFIDACQSGGSVEGLAVRGAMDEKAIAQLSRSAGVHVFASSGSNQFSKEFDILGHGLFTWVLLKAMKGEADGAPYNGEVTVYEIKSFLDELVPEYSQQYQGETQYPYTFSKGDNFPVSINTQNKNAKLQEGE